MMVLLRSTPNLEDLLLESTGFGDGLFLLMGRFPCVPATTFTEVGRALSECPPLRSLVFRRDSLPITVTEHLGSIRGLTNLETLDIDGVSLFQSIRIIDQEFLKELRTQSIEASLPVTVRTLTVEQPPMWESELIDDITRELSMSESEERWEAAAPALIIQQLEGKITEGVIAVMKNPTFNKLSQVILKCQELHHEMTQSPPMGWHFATVVDEEEFVWEKD